MTVTALDGSIITSLIAVVMRQAQIVLPANEVEGEDPATTVRREVLVPVIALLGSHTTSVLVLNRALRALAPDNTLMGRDTG